MTAPERYILLSKGWTCHRLPSQLNLSYSYSSETAKDLVPGGHFGLVETALSKVVQEAARVLRGLGNHLQEDQGGREGRPQLLVELPECQPGVVFASLFRKAI